MGQLMTLLNGALDARGKVLLKLNVAAERYDAVLAVLPSAKSPTVSRARRRRWLRRRERRRQAHDQPADPGAARRRGDRSAGDADLQDRAVEHRSTGHGHRSSTSTSGLGVITTPDGGEFPFHCVEIADGTRTIDVGDRRRVRAAAQARPRRGGGDPPDRAMSELAGDITAVIASLAPGEVVSYGDVAHDAGRPGAARAVGAPAGEHGRRAAVVARGPRRRPHRHRQPGAPGGATARRGCRRPPRPRRRRPRRSLRSTAVAAADLMLTNAMRMFDSASRSVGESGPSRSPRPSTRMPTASIASEAAGRFGGLADRWMAASSYRPITWLVTTTSAGTSARRVRTSSIACSASSIRVSAASVSAASAVSAAAPRRRRPDWAWNRRARELPYWGHIEAKWGRPPPGHHHGVSASGSYGTTGRMCQLSSAGFASS